MKLTSFLKKIIPFLFLIFFIWLSIKRTDGFSTKLITRFKIDNKTYEVKIDENIDEIKEILSQDYHYLTRGRECYIFESNDEKYVIKFFDCSRYYTKIYFPSIPLPKYLESFRAKHYNRRKTKLNFNLSSAKIAYERLKQDAALVYVNLNKTNLFNNKLYITNKYGKSFLLDLNDIFFILQKKCELFYLNYEKSDEDHKKYLLESFLEMVHRRTEKLVIDDDIGKKRRNWGIYNNKAVTFDIGRWYHDEKLQTPYGYKKEMIKATKILKKYLTDNEPEKLALLKQKLEEYFKNFEENYALKCKQNQSVAK